MNAVSEGQQSTDHSDRDPPSVTLVAETFPRQYARTQRLTLGDPRDVSVSTDGRRIVFLRSRAGDDPVNCLWVTDANTGDERLVADPPSCSPTTTINRRRPPGRGAGPA